MAGSVELGRLQRQHLGLRVGPSSSRHTYAGSCGSRQHQQPQTCVAAAWSKALRPLPSHPTLVLLPPLADMGVPAEAVAEAYDAFERGEVASPLSAAAVSNQTIQESMRLLLMVRAFQVTGHYAGGCWWALVAGVVGAGRLERGWGGGWVGGWVGAGVVGCCNGWLAAQAVNAALASAPCGCCSPSCCGLAWPVAT